MSLYKRNGIYYADFVVDGFRYRESTKESDWREAKNWEKERIAQIKGGKGTSTQKITRRRYAKMTFNDAADDYLEAQKVHHAAKTRKLEVDRLKPLRRCYGTLKLRQITLEKLQQYRSERMEKGPSNRTINLEVGIFRRIMKRAKRWYLFEDEIKPLKENHDAVGRALLPEQRDLLIHLASQNQQWENAYNAMELALHTTMRGCEIRGLQWKDVNFFEKTVIIRKSKTDAGRRLVPLNANAMAAILRLKARAEKLKTAEPEHYIFPACENLKYDPTKPQNSWRSAWRSLVRKCDKSKLCSFCKSAIDREIHQCPHCKSDVKNTPAPPPLKGFRFHDCRHAAITELAESQTSDQTIMSIAGHVSRQMLEHYSHIRMAAKRSALKGLETERGVPGLPDEKPQIEVIH
jgi:integrase